MNEILKPCPFCGGEAYVDTCETCRYVHVTCSRCRATGTNYTPIPGNGAQNAECRRLAIEAWNRRAVPLP